MKTDNLLPCPFCGTQPEWINEAIADDHFYIRCPNCHIVMKEDRRDKVIGMWNTRVVFKQKRIRMKKTMESIFDYKAPGFNDYHNK